MLVPRNHDSRLLDFARTMRESCTDAEAKLWQQLRGRSLNGYKFCRQHPLAGYILDFYCARCRLAVELDGGQHGDGAAKRYDARRTERLNELGVRVLRFRDDEVLREPQIVAEEILRHLVGEEPSPQPSP